MTTVMLQGWAATRFCSLVARYDCRVIGKDMFQHLKHLDHKSTHCSEHATTHSPKSQRAVLFSQSTDSNPDETEAQLNAHCREQDLTSDMLSLACALKESSIRFGQGFEKEKGLLDVAGEGFDRSARGIEGAGRRMHVLRKGENVNFMWTVIYVAATVGLVSLGKED